MGYTNSKLVNYTKLSPNHSGTRTHKIDRITPHCVVGQVSVESLGNLFAQSSREVSSNYGIGEDGRVGLYVEEKNRSWCSSSNENDQRAITIECASDATAPYAFKTVVYNKLVELCIDICKRNGIKKVYWFNDKEKSLKYAPKDGECVLTVHRWFANKSCPGDWMYARMGDLAKKINAALTVEEKPVTATATTYKAGQKVTLKNANLYVSSTAKSAARKVTGTYCTWDNTIVNNRIRITTSVTNVGKTGQVTGWIDVPKGSISAAKATVYKKRQKVKLVNVPLYASSTGASVGKISGTYYIYDGIKMNGRYRITNSYFNCGKTPMGKYVTGYVDL